MAADKKFLGLGVVFKGVDDGFSKTIDKVSDKTNKAAGQFDKLQKKIDGIGKNNVVNMNLRLVKSDKVIDDFQKKIDSFKNNVIKFPEIKTDKALVQIGKVKNNLEKVSSDIIDAKFTKLPDTDSNTSLVPVGPEKVGGLKKEQTESAKSTVALSQSLIDLRGNFKGTEKQKDSLINNFKKFDEKIDETGKGTDKLSDKLKKTKFSFGDINSFFENTARLSTGLNVSHVAEQFDDLFKRMSLVYDSKSVEKFKSTTLRGLTLGVMPAEAKIMAEGLADFGVSAKDAVSVLPTMQDMVGKLGMDAGQVANMFGAGLQKLQMSPKALVGITKEFAKVGRSYGFVKPLEELPNVIKQVVNSTYVFGAATRKQAPQIVMSIAKVAGGFKSMGLAQKEAMSASLSFQDTNVDMLEQLQRMSVGLDFDDKVFKKFGGSIAEVTGKSEAEILSTFGNIGADTEKTIAYLQDVYKVALSKGGGYATRFTLQMKDLYRANPEIVQAITTQQEAFKKVSDEAEETATKLGTPEESWAKMTTTMESSLLVSRRMTEATEQLLTVVMDLSMASEKVASNKRYRESLIGIANAVSTVSDSLKMFNAFRAGNFAEVLNQLGYTNAASILSYFKGFGAAITGILIPAIMLLGATLSPIFSMLKTLGKVFLKLFSGITKVSSGVAKASSGAAKGVSTFSKFGKSFSGMSKVLGKALVPLGIILSFIEDIPAAMEAFGKGNFGEGVLNLLFGKSKEGEGLSTMFGQMFKFAGIGMLLGGPVGAAIGAALGAIISFVKSGLERGFGTVWDELLEGVGNFFGRIGAFVAPFVNTVVDKIKSVGSSISDFFMGEGSGFPKVLGKIVGFVGTLVKNALATIPNAIFDLINFISPEVERKISIFGDKMKSVFSVAIDWIADKISFLFDKLANVPILGKASETLRSFIKDYTAGMKEGYQLSEDFNDKMNEVQNTIGVGMVKSANKFTDAIERGYKGEILQSKKEEEKRKEEKKEEGFFDIISNTLKGITSKTKKVLDNNKGMTGESQKQLGNYINIAAIMDRIAEGENYVLDRKKKQAEEAVKAAEKQEPKDTSLGVIKLQDSQLGDREFSFFRGKRKEFDPSHFSPLGELDIPREVLQSGPNVAEAAASYFQRSGDYGKLFPSQSPTSEGIKVTNDQPEASRATKQEVGRTGVGNIDVMQVLDSLTKAVKDLASRQESVKVEITGDVEKFFSVQQKNQRSVSQYVMANASVY